MSTIVAVRKGNTACIAADTLLSLGDIKVASDYVVSSEKIIYDGENYIGIVGSAAHDFVVRSILQDDKFEYDFSSRMLIFESFREMHALLKERYYLNPKEDNEDAYESSRIDALIVNPHGIFSVLGLREVSEYSKYWAIGAGDEIALGALFASYDAHDEAEAIAKIAISASAEFHNSTALPAHLHIVELKQ